MPLTQVLVSELLGTAVLILLGAGVVANVLLPKNGGYEGGPLMINFGWGLAVFAGVFAGYKSGAHLNPAITIGIWASGAHEYAKGVPITAASTCVYFVGQFLGAFSGAVLAWMAYKKQFDERDADSPTNIFSTAPTVRHAAWNVATEAIATFILVFIVLSFGKTPSQLGPLAVALLVVGIGASLGGPTGYAINPARDLAPRLAHALLPIPNKESSNWSYAWVPVAGPVIGGLLAGLLAQVYLA